MLQLVLRRDLEERSVGFEKIGGFSLPRARRTAARENHLPDLPFRFLPQKADAEFPYIAVVGELVVLELVLGRDLEVQIAPDRVPGFAYREFVLLQPLEQGRRLPFFGIQS